MKPDLTKVTRWEAIRDHEGHLVYYQRYAGPARLTVTGSRWKVYSRLTNGPQDVLATGTARNSASAKRAADESAARLADAIESAAQNYS